MGTARGQTFPRLTGAESSKVSTGIMNSDTVTLTWTECLICAQIGSMWEISGRFGPQDRNRYGGDIHETWKSHIEGAAGEYAVGKFLDKHWDFVVFNPKDRFEKVPDVGPYQVRQAEKHHYRLTLRKGADTDKPDVPFILVTGVMPNFRVRGWVYGREAMQDRYWSDPDGGGYAWWVPVANLRLMSTLP